MYQPHSHIGYHRLGSAHSVLNNPRYRILQSSLATLIQLKNQEEDDFKVHIYEHSIVLIKQELSALTARFV
jgi:hypothetical protein